MEFKVTKKLHLICLCVSFGMFYFLRDFVDKSVQNLSISTIINYPTPNIMVNFFIISLTLVALISVIHELIHALFYKIFGGKPVIGFKYIYAYTMETSKIAIQSWKFIVILLTPLIFISLTTLFIGTWITHYMFFLNLIGSTGDIVMSIVVLRYGIAKTIIDSPTGFTIS